MSRLGASGSKFTPRFYTDTPQAGHSPNFHPLTGVESSNAFIASIRFRGITKFKEGELESMVFVGQESLQVDHTEIARIRYASVFCSFVLLVFILPCCSPEPQNG